MTHILADTLSCISVDEAEKLGIFYLPQIIIFGDESLRDDSEIDSETFIQRLKNSPELPKTSAPYPSLYTPILKKLVKTGEPILIICPTEKASGTFRSAEVAVNDFPNANIHVVDTLLLGTGLGSVVHKAVEWQQSGLSSDEIEKRVKELSSRNRTYFLVDTLEYLYKGGRIGTAKALVGSVLQMKPILAINGGQVEAVTTERTRKKALAKFIEIIVSECPKGEKSLLTIQHGENLDQAKSLAEELKKALDVKDIPLSFLPPAIMVHAGPSVLGVSFFVE